MDISLQKMLLLVCTYGAAGLFFLSSARIAKTKIEQFFSGLILVIHASFLLAVVGYLSTSLTDLATSNESTVYIREQVGDFVPIIVFMGGLFTFLFGGVGTNFVSASLSARDNADIMAHLEKLTSQVERIERHIKIKKRSNYKRIVVNFLVLGFVLLGIYSQL